MKKLLLVLLLAPVLKAQTVTMTGPTTAPPVVTLSWTAPSVCTLASPCGYIPFRIIGQCPSPVIGSTGWTQLPQTANQVGSTTDSSITPGITYSYVVKTAQGATNLSGPSNCVTVIIPNVLSPATGLTAVNK
jgi:hypothetical protein